MQSKKLYHFFITVETFNFLLGSCKKGTANKCIFQFFFPMLCISLVLLIFPYSAQILLENALFCRQNARPQNRLFCSKFCRHNLSKPNQDTLRSRQQNTKIPSSGRSLKPKIYGFFVSPVVVYVEKHP